MKSFKTQDDLGLKHIWLRRKEHFKKKLNEPKNLLR